MRVSIFHRNLDIAGGGERIVLELANRLCERGYEIRLYTFGFNPDRNVTRPSPKVSIELIPWRRVSPWPLYNEVASILLFPMAFKWGDIVFWSDFHTGQIAAVLLSKLLNKPIIYYCHWPLLYSVENEPRFLQYSRRLPLNILDRLLTTKVDVFMSNSKHTAQYVRQVYGIDPKVVQPGVDVEKFQHTPVKEGPPTVLTVCRADPVKRIDLLIRAIRLVQMDLRDVKLYVVGSTEYSPDYARYLVSLTKKLGLDRTVFFTGKLFGETLVRFYQMCDVFCLSSREETFGIAVLEAMCCEKPVVVSAAGALPELVEDGKTGFIIKCDREEEWAEKIKFLLKHPEIRARMGKEGRKLAETRYSWDVFADSIDDAIKRLVKC